jgi:RluA family pseudouridine synthase
MRVGMRRWVVRAEDGDTVGAIVARAGGDPRAIADGRVFLDRKRVRDPNVHARPGDVVEIAPPVREVPGAAILGRVGDLVAAVKPAGMPTIADHAGAVHALVNVVARLSGIELARLHPTSRLDRDVSGVVLIAASKEARDRLQRAREEGRYARLYVAIAARAPSPEAGSWDTPIGRTKDPRLRAANGAGAVPASTGYRTVAVATGHALLAVSPVTGRTHQIRVHASHAGAPLLGDRAYGGPTRITLPGGKVLALARIALHAARVAVPGEDGQLVAFEAPIPEDLRATWTAFGGDAEAWSRAREA